MTVTREHSFVVDQPIDVVASMIRATVVGHRRLVLVRDGVADGGAASFELEEVRPGRVPTTIEVRLGSAAGRTTEDSPDREATTVVLTSTSPTMVRGDVFGMYPRMLHRLERDLSAAPTDPIAHGVVPLTDATVPDVPSLRSVIGTVLVGSIIVGAIEASVGAIWPGRSFVVPVALVALVVGAGAMGVLRRRARRGPIDSAS